MWRFRLTILIFIKSFSGQLGKCVHFQIVGLVYAFYLARREGTSLGSILEGPLPCELDETEPTFYLPHSRQIRERKALFFLRVWGDCFWPDHVQFFGGWRGKIFVSKGVWKGKSFVSNVVWKGKNFVSLWMCKGKTLSQNGCVKAKTSFRKFVDKSHFEFLYLLQSQFHERPRSVKGSLCFLSDCVHKLAFSLQVMINIVPEGELIWKWKGHSPSILDCKQPLSIAKGTSQNIKETRTHHFSPVAIRMNFL